MNTLSAIVLGILQGFTEFLPVSSSGHLVIMREILGVKEALVSFDVFVHLGTLAAVVFVFRREALSLVAGFVAWGRDLVRIGRERRTGFHPDNDKRLFTLVFLGSIPAGLAGLLFREAFERLFGSAALAGGFLILTGILLRLGEALTREVRSLEELSYPGALLIGIAQACAIAPGLSRSGSTISAGLILGLRREDAASYSFLLAIPAILGGSLLELKDLLPSILGGLGVAFLAGGLAAAISGYLAIRLVLDALRRGGLSLFSYYCWALGIGVLIWQLTR